MEARNRERGRGFGPEAKIPLFARNLDILHARPIIASSRSRLINKATVGVAKDRLRLHGDVRRYRGKLGPGETLFGAHE
jgi:hypothetical protein